jgi:transcriptional regulator with PAS, ATPase and Fis domain
VLEDRAVSRIHCEIRSDAAGHSVHDLGSTNGTFVDGYRAVGIFLRPTSLIRVGETEIGFRILAEVAEIASSPSPRFGSVVGESVAMREVFAVLERAAATPATILLEGESGTGKEVVARSIHERSHRAGGPFEVFDCGAVPATLVESELFGHERGAFTGATERRIGLMEAASGGTLFVDELGELPLELQPKLLRVLERREIRRLGGTEVVPVDVRVIAATNRDLSHEVNRGAFREDLYYRVAVVRVCLPPLRDRREDIRPLAEHFIRRALPGDGEADRVIATIGEPDWGRLLAHPWRGNVRELRNVIERSLALGEAQLTPYEPSGRGRPPALDIDLDRPFVLHKGEIVDAFERAYLLGQLARHDGNVSRAARAAGLERMNFKRALKKYQ